MSERIACIDVPSLPLQILRRDHPEWGGFPLAVVAEDRPQASVLAVSRSALKLGIRPGMRYAAALGITRELRAGVVAERRVAEVRAELVGALFRLSPRVEPDRERVSVVWVDPSGMLALYSSYQRWAREAQGALSALNLFGTIVVGFHRLPTLAVARAEQRSRERIEILGSEDEERRRAGEAPLVRLDLPPSISEALHLFGLRTLRELLALPPGEVSVRLGPEALALHQSFAGKQAAPLHPVRPDEPIVIDAEIEPPDDDRARLLFCIKGALVALTSALTERRMGLGVLHVSLSLERGPHLVPREPVCFSIEPATSSRETMGLSELCRLRLEALSLPARVEKLSISATARTLDQTQLLLTESTRRRDPKALARGLSRLRAAFGDTAVTRGRLLSSWAPEASFCWEPVQDVPTPRVQPPGHQPPPLIRRVLATPLALDSDGRGLPRLRAAVVRLVGPYRVQSGWWQDRIERDYFYAEQADGGLLWLYRESQGRWFLQGLVD